MAANNKPTDLDRLRDFRQLMGGTREQFQNMSDEEYLQYLEQSESLCGRLWANLNADDGEDPEILSVSDIYESLAVDEEEGQRDERSFSFCEVDGPEFTDEILSSTFIIDDDPEFFDVFDVLANDFSRIVFLEESKALRKPTTSPCA